jgi:outer membrane lipase/esterase
MRKTSYALALLAAAALTACGGNGPSAGNQTFATKFSQQVVFGDSLSDVGTYAVGGVALMGGGTYTINGDNTAVSPDLTGKNYTVLVAAQLGLPVPCAAQTGLMGTASTNPVLNFSVPVTMHADCYNYAQGGSRVIEPIGPGNAALAAPGTMTIGSTTVPVVTQIANHLKKVGGKFKGDELVIVMAGGNDALELLGELTAGATKAGGDALVKSLITQLAPGMSNPATAQNTILAAIQAANSTDPTVIIGAAIRAAALNGNTAAAANAASIGATAGAAAQAAGLQYQSANAASLVTKMGTAGAQLGALVEQQIVANGATHVVVNNLPDVSISPSALAQSADTQKLIATMVSTFNSQLQSAVASDAKVLYVDLASISHDQATNPKPYGLTNTTTPACDLSTAKNPLGSSLVCNGKNLIAGDVSHYMFADSVHPTPFEYALIARYVLEQMSVKGWL